MKRKIRAFAHAREVFGTVIVTRTCLRYHIVCIRVHHHKEQAPEVRRHLIFFRVEKIKKSIVLPGYPRAKMSFDRLVSEMARKDSVRTRWKLKCLFGIMLTPLLTPLYM